MKKSITYLAGLFYIALFITSCCPCTRMARAVKPLAGTAWQLAQMEGRTFDAADGYVLRFTSDGKVAGIARCNAIEGTYRSNDDAFLKIAATVGDKECAQAATEAKLVRLLGTVDHYQMDGYTMLLFSNGEMILAFEGK